MCCCSDVEGDGGVGMSYKIIQKLDYFPLGAARRFVVFQSQAPECHIECTVHCLCIVKELSIIWLVGIDWLQVMALNHLVVLRPVVGCC